MAVETRGFDHHRQALAAAFGDAFAELAQQTDTGQFTRELHPNTVGAPYRALAWTRHLEGLQADRGRWGEHVRLLVRGTTTTSPRVVVTVAFVVPDRRTVTDTDLQKPLELLRRLHNQEERGA